MSTDRDPAIDKRLKQFGQEHLLAFWDDLDEPQRQRLLEQIERIDFAQIQSLREPHGNTESFAEMARRADSPPAIALNETDHPISRAQAEKRGQQALREGKVGMVLVAGGQGSRLGFPHPKGMFPIGPISNRSLYEIFFDLVRANASKYGKAIPLYVMTSPPTHQATTEFLQENNYFGIPESDVRIFCQGTMPAVDAESGRLLLADKDELFLSPDGHGGTLIALEKSGCLQEIRQRGLEYLFYGQIDNPLIQLCDPLTIGYHILCQSEMTSQAVRKLEPSQRVGNFAAIDGRVHIIEYSDLPETLAAQRRDDGSLKFWAGSIAVHVFDVPFLERMVEKSDSLPFHLARKRVPFLGGGGKRVEPEGPNAIKFERFIFDLLPLANNAIVIEIDAADGFAAVKNAADAATETAATSQAAMIAQHRRWLEAAQIQVQDGVAVEINPRFAIDVHELGQKLAGTEMIERPTYFHE